mmetsp:Transcript_23848/g.68600  ORF Transcript_23848/g.68600 Transcript_23848/m.68600 type:complete len:146 (+) Transcript_23848:294-731(+)
MRHTGGRQQGTAEAAKATGRAGAAPRMTAHQHQRLASLGRLQLPLGCRLPWLCVSECEAWGLFAHCAPLTDSLHLPQKAPRVSMTLMWAGPPLLGAETPGAADSAVSAAASTGPLQRWPAAADGRESGNESGARRQWISLPGCWC